MKRARHLVILMGATAIGSMLWSRVTPALTLPPTVDRWSIAGAQTCAKPATTKFQIWPGTSGARLVCHAEYTGSPKVVLTIYEMPNHPGATAFGPFQEWQTGRREPGIVAFHYHAYLGIVESPNADMNALNHFAAAVEATLHH